MQVNINKYNQIKFEEEFKTTDLYQHLKKDYDILSFDSIWQDDTRTPRQVAAGGRTKFSVVPFYYLKFLIDANPTDIYDLGCGWNIFKKYIPNIIGVGAEDTPEDFFGDIHDFVDDDYIKDHQNQFESVFSINALHFYPLSKIRQRVLDFASMIKDNGVGFLTLNCQRMIEADNNIISDNLEQYVRTELDNLPFKLKVFDVDLTKLDQPMDGNIRIVIKK